MLSVRVERSFWKMPFFGSDSLEPCPASTVLLDSRTSGAAPLAAAGAAEACDTARATKASRSAALTMEKRRFSRLGPMEKVISKQCRRLALLSATAATAMRFS